MKKVLFATTALIMSAGFAAAEVGVSGDGRMGLVYNGDDVEFTSRARVKFTLSGETDSGLSFGGSFRVDHEDEDGASASKGGAGTVYISGAYGKLTMGDVDSAAENAVGDLSGVGLTGLGDYNEFTYIASGGEVNGNPGALYEYSFGGATVYASMLDGQNDLDLDGDDDKQYSVGAKFGMGGYSFGIGYEKTEVGFTNTDLDHVIVGGEGTFGAATVKAIYGTADDIDFDQYGLSVDYVAGATTFTGFYRRVELGSAESDTWGIGAEHDLGGGAKLVGGIVDSDFLSDTVADFGVSFKF